jgi:tetraprenyl-beta-curcumene synthase
MARQARGRGLPAAAAVALVSANLRYWPTVYPHVRRELRRWDRRALAIPDERLRAQALAKLQGERFNTEVAATLATLAPPAQRARVITAIVAMEVMYDYLDGLTEQPVADPLANGRQLYRAFADALTPCGPSSDHYRHHPQVDDGGYLAALAAACREALWSLPAAPATAPVALAVASRCGEAQTRTHLVARAGATQLAAWAAAQPECPSLHWWEMASGAAASVLAVHALLASAADPGTTAETAERIATAYFATCALTTLLDSLVDADDDADGRGHAYLSYYRDEQEAAARLGFLAQVAVAAASELPRAAHHLMTVAGAVAFYLSAPLAGAARGRRVTMPVVTELRPLLAPARALFDVWRWAKRRRWIGRRGAKAAGNGGGMESRVPGTMGAMHSTSSNPARTVSSLGHRLERDRLERRAVRVKQVIRALRERANAREGDSATPRPLTAAIEDFGRELAELERRLRQPAQ